MAHTHVFDRITTQEKCTVSRKIARYSRSDAYLPASEVAVESPGTLVPWYPGTLCAHEHAHAGHRGTEVFQGL
jgi:hypothetical protein